MVAAGAASVIVWVLADNQRARGFYESIGLRAAPEAGERAIKVDGTPAKEVRYVLHSAGAAAYDHP